MTKVEMISFLYETYKKIPLNMLRAMARSLENNSLEDAFSFYKNDRDKLLYGTDKDIRNKIEDFFISNGFQITWKSR